MSKIQITCGSTLSQDFITSDSVLVDGGKPGQVAVFRNPLKDEAVEALVLSDAGGAPGQLFYLARDESSLTGFRLDAALGDDAPIIAREVVAFANTWGGVDAFFLYDGGIGHLSLAGNEGGWTRDEDLSVSGVSHATLAGLAVSFSPGATASQGAAIVYGADADGNMLLCYGKDGTWSGASMPLGGPAASFSVSLKDETSWLLTLVAAETYHFRPGGGEPLGSVQEYWAAWAWGAIDASGATVEDGQILYGTKLDSVVCNAPAASGTLGTMMVLLDKANAGDGGHAVGCLLRPGDADESYQLIDGTSFKSAAVAIASDGRVTIYGIDPEMNLFTLRQTGAEPSSVSSGTSGSDTWGPLLQLDKRMLRMVSVENPQSAPALIGIDADVGGLHLYVMDPTTALWSAQPIALETTTKYDITRWRTEINLYDADGNALTNYDLTISAASAVDIDVNGRFHVVDSDRSAAVTTNSLGKATVSSLATSLTPPAFVFAAEGLSAQESHSPGGAVNDYLAGTGTILGKGAFDITAVDELNTSGDIDSEAALDAIQLCAQMGQQAGGQPEARTKLTRQVASGSAVHVFSRRGERACHRVFRSRAEADSFASARLSVGSLWDDVWDPAKQYAGDVWHGISEGVSVVESVLVDVAKGAVQIVVWIGDQLVTLADWVISTVEDALHAITAIFSWIAGAIEAVIEWLRMLFDFEAIWNTKKALATQLSALPDYLISQIDTLSDLADGFFSSQKDAINGYFDAAIAKYDAGQLAQIDGWAPMGNPPGGTSVAGGAVSSDFFTNVDGNWLMDKLCSHGPSSIGDLPTCDDGAAQNFYSAIISAGQDLLDAYTDFGNGVAALFDANDLTTFENVVIATVLRLAQDLVNLVLDIFDALVQALLSLGVGAITAFKALLTTKLDLGYISDCYDWIADLLGLPKMDLTAGELICLAAAFPITITYKLIAGVDKEPFPNGKVPSASPETMTRLKAASRGKLAALASTDDSSLPRTFGTVAGVLTIIGAVWSTWSDAMDTPPGWLSAVSKGTTALRLAFTHPDWVDWGPLEWGTTSAAAASMAWVAPAAYFINQDLNVTGGTKAWVETTAQSSGLASWSFDDVTKAGMSVWGIFSLGSTLYGVATYDEPLTLKSMADIIEGIVAPFSFLTMTPIKDTPIGPYAVPFKMALDVVCGLEGGILEVTSAWTET